MPLNFPTAPSVNDTYTFNGRTWKWNGEGWAAEPASYGPQGPQGPQGTQGPQGSTGAAYTVPFTTDGDNTIDCSLDLDRVITRSANGTVTFTGSNYTEGYSVTVRVVCDGTQRTLNFPTNWVFVTVKPTAIAANKTGILTVTSFGTTEANCVAAWTVQA